MAQTIVMETWPAKLNIMLIILTSNLKIEKLKTKIKPSFTQPILCDRHVPGYLEHFIENMESF